MESHCNTEKRELVIYEYNFYQQRILHLLLTPVVVVVNATLLSPPPSFHHEDENLLDAESECTPCYTSEIEVLFMCVTYFGWDFKLAGKTNKARCQRVIRN